MQNYTRCLSEINDSFELFFVHRIRIPNRFEDLFTAENTMGSVNSIPVVSQIKSFVQWLFGDTDGAKKTQEDFVQECPIISQVTND